MSVIDNEVSELKFAEYVCAASISYNETDVHLINYQEEMFQFIGRNLNHTQRERTGSGLGSGNLYR